ncbi:DUF5825 family protein [Actinoplanes sp. HUAS TT8]|uniref:DUF5825 family protein n=1 Tax=Actinoplanes sp. HUAS TT8 TaxID=3447453 RepID=UPI003F526984
MPLPLVATPYRLPRTAGAGRVVAPSLPLNDPESLIAALGRFGPVTVASHRISIACPPDRLGALAQEVIRGPAIEVRIDVPPPAESGPAAVAALAVAGVDRLVVSEPVGAATADWIELAKAALTHGLPLHWTGTAGPEFAHLVPARTDLEGRRRWRYGLLTWRRGPGFVLVDDRRDSEDRRSLVIDSPPLVEAFGPELDRPAAGTAGTDPLLAELAGVGLVTSGPVAVWLPYRMLRLPVAPPDRFEDS